MSLRFRNPSNDRWVPCKTGKAVAQNGFREGQPCCGSTTWAINPRKSSSTRHSCRHHSLSHSFVLTNKNSGTGGGGVSGHGYPSSPINSPSEVRAINVDLLQWAVLNSDSEN